MNKPNYQIYVMLTCLVLVTSCSKATPEITTVFAEGLELTDDELNNVLSLAQNSGVTNVLPVTTGYMSHSFDRDGYVFVEETESIVSGKARYRVLYIKRKQWSTESVPDENLVQLGEFWVSSINNIELSVLHIGDNEYRFKVDKNISIDMATTILENLLRGDYTLKGQAAQELNGNNKSKEASVLLNQVGKWTPIELGYDISEGLYSFQFEGERKGGPCPYLRFGFDGCSIELIEYFSIQM